MSDADSDSREGSRMKRLARAVPEPWRTMLLAMLTFLALAFCSTIQFPSSAPDGHYFVSFAPSSWPDSSPPDAAADSLPRVTLYLASSDLGLPCFRRSCGTVRARGSYAFLRVDSTAKIDSALTALRLSSPSASMAAVGYADRRDDSAMTVILSPGTPDSMTIRFRYVRRGGRSYYVGPTCAGPCTRDLPLKAFAIATRA